MARKISCHVKRQDLIAGCSALLRHGRTKHFATSNTVKTAPSIIVNTLTRVDRVRIELAGEDDSVALAAECTARVFDGRFRLRVTEGEDAGNAGAADRGLPMIEAGEAVTVSAVRAERHVAAPPERHTEAGLVRRLEEHGIGRPSTWAAIIAVLQARG